MLMWPLLLIKIANGAEPMADSDTTASDTSGAIFDALNVAPVLGRPA